MMQDRIALFGAAGVIGHSIAEELRSRGRSYRVVGRRRKELEDAFGKDSLAEISTWNPDDPESVKAVAQNIDTLVYLVGVPYDQFKLHPIVLEKTLAGAITAGVKRFVLIGTVYVYGYPQTPKVAEDHPREPHTFKGKMRKAQEDILLEAHAAGRIQATILHLPDFYGPNVQASFLHFLFEGAAKGVAGRMIGPIDRPHEYVFVPDVGPVVLDLAANPQAYGHAWNLAGAGSIIPKQIAEQAFRLAGRSLKLQVIGKTMLRLIGLFQPFMREMVEMHYLITRPVLMDDRALHRLLGHIHKTSYEEGVRKTFAAYAAKEHSHPVRG